MDYTDLTNVKASMDAQVASADTILPPWITKASRYIDRLSTSQPNVSDYFKAEDVVDEVLTNGMIDYAGRLWVYPHKPIINSVAALSYRFSLKDAWSPADMTLVVPMQEVVQFEGSLPYNEMTYVKISYNGGLGATLADLPQDLIDIVTVQTVRLYKEARSGLGDAIGIQELGSLIYTKAFAARVMESLNDGNYIRTAPWT